MMNLVYLNALVFEGDSTIIKEEYHCKEESELEWDEQDNAYDDDEPKLSETSHEVIVKSEADEDVQMLHQNAGEPSKQPNALLKLIKRCCPKCNNLSDITETFLYKKKKCVTCSTVSLLFQCVKCGKRYSHYSSIHYHILTKCSPGDYYDCPNCPYKTTIRSQLAKHVKRVHDEKNNRRALLRCKTCGKEFKYTYSLNRHLRKSCGLSFPRSFVRCEHCDKKFKDRGYLKEHEKVCRQEVMLKCDHCEFGSKHKRRLILHLRNKHFGKKFLNF